VRAAFLGVVLHHEGGSVNGGVADAGRAVMAHGSSRRGLWSLLRQIKPKLIAAAELPIRELDRGALNVDTPSKLLPHCLRGRAGGDA